MSDIQNMSLVTKLLINSRHCPEIFLRRPTNYFFLILFGLFFFGFEKVCINIVFHPVMKHLIFFRLHFVL